MEPPPPASPSGPPPRSAPRYCVLIPAFNASATIGALVRAIKQYGFDIIVIDDGSSDGTAASASTAGALVMSLLKNQGKGVALRTGFTYAVRQRYEGVITMDGDGQHDPADIARLVSVAEAQHAGIVVGNRMTDVTSMPRIRVWKNGVMSRIISRPTRQAIPDPQCGFRFIRTEVLAHLPLRAKRYEIETEMLFSAAAHQWRIVSVPVRTIYTDRGSHIRPVRDTLRFLKLVFRHLVSP